MRVKIIECPRDAMQGLDRFVPTETKITYINALLKVGYHTLDCGSFVSPKAIPQMRDTEQVLSEIDASNTKLSVIVANEQGINDAVKMERVNYLGYPFSISETFQQRNTRHSIIESLDVVKHLQEKALKFDKEVVIYISMGFGNPYNEDWSSALVVDWVGKIAEIGIHSFSISDTVGVSKPADIEDVYTKLIAAYPTAEFGAHFHTRKDNWEEKIEAAWKSGCARFDGAISGYGGCPMAADKLVGNMPTENLVRFFDEHTIVTGLNKDNFNEAMLMAEKVFG